MLRRFVRYWVGKVVARPLHRKFAAFEAACQDPQRTQEELLRQVVGFHRDTGFGKDHGFATIRTVDDYRRQFHIVQIKSMQALRDRGRLQQEEIEC